MKIEEAIRYFGTRISGVSVHWMSTVAFTLYRDDLRLWYLKSKDNSVGKNTIVLESKNPSTLSDEDLFNEWINYTKTINDGCREVETTKVNVYDIRIKEEKVVKEKEKEKEKNVCDEKTDTSTLLLLNYINQSKEKEEPEKTVKVIKSELMNQVYKSFDTLYLQKNDEFVLKSTLERFKDKRELFSTLGIPYKLGVLLHGEPGCGKSSVITAIASYLKRDIFYLDLSGVSTNEDLKNLFKYINTQENKNGIIVMEDIDTMCKIVLKRTETNTGISENGQLTLDCLLNLLQGTLTEDGLIFIATTNHLEKIDPAFYREGRFDVNINMKPCDEYQMQCIYKKFFNKQIPQEYLDKLKPKSITPAKFISNLLPFVLKPDNEDTEILKVFLY
jgi:ATP-dependent 26S proteasome regulatory subunit